MGWGQLFMQMAGTVSRTVSTLHCEETSFLIALILTNILSFLELLTHYNHSELVSSIWHMTTPENASGDYHILSKAFFPLTPRPSFCHSLPAPSACTNLSMSHSKLQAQHSAPDLTCLWQHTADLLHPLNETLGFLKPCSQLMYLGLKPGFSRFVLIQMSFLLSAVCYILPCYSGALFWSVQVF